MHFRPIDRMFERIEIAKESSDADLFLNLLYMGEMLTKIVGTGLVAAVNDGPDRHRYRQLYQLVRADSMGDWSRIIDEVLTGATSQHLARYAYVEQNELNSVNREGAWQYESVALLNDCLKLVDPRTEDLQNKVSGRLWFSIFAALRNKTRGHGAIPSSKYGLACSKLEDSLKLLIDNFSLFQRGWAYLYQNLSGKYRVTRWTERAELLEFLKKKQDRMPNLPNGIYIHFDESSKLDGLFKVELIESTVDALDFFFANGCFNGKRFEMISYVSGDKLDGDAKPYLLPITNLPPSETQGLPQLVARGESLVTVPPSL